MSYMKMADAYMKKDNYKSAAKQFLKVLKKAPHHIPAILGYASSFERYANNKQLGEVAIAYSNVTQYAIAQENPRFAQAVLYRALSVSKDMERSSGGAGGDRMDVLRHLASLSFTNEIASDMYYEMGSELWNNQKKEADAEAEADAKTYFKMANGFAVAAKGSEDGSGSDESESGSGFHAQSLAILGEIALSENKPKLALSYLEKALTADLGDLAVDALYHSARAKEAVNDLSGAIETYKRALSSNLTPTAATANAHYHLAMAMKSADMESAEIEQHMELALNMGFELTDDAIGILGDNHMAVIKSAHRAEYKRYQEALSSNEQRGGIMNGSGVSNNESIFSSPQDGNDGSDNANGNDNSDGSDPLSMLEQGAASYDGSSPLPIGDGDGDRDDDDDDDDDGDGKVTITSSSQQSRAKASAK